LLREPASVRNGRPFRRVAFPDVRVLSLGDSRDDDLDQMAAFYRGLRAAEWIVECYRCTSVGMAFATMGFVEGHIQRRTTMWDIAGGFALCREAGLDTVISRDSNTGQFAVAVATPALLEDAALLWPGLQPG
jgi:myo-inositol-1(or 4)-monophosphatase